ncbi:hypothetical protein EDD22DRAFT_852540 [Suillus occidentalis]|nr:hypothetical protein EDD22DRAFT_852540 [Suillus occidentalis]
MSTNSNPVIALANAAFYHIDDKVEHMSHVFSVYALQTTAMPPMVLSVAAELQEHLDSSFYKVVSTPVWTNIHPDNPHDKISPLYPKSVGYDQPPPPSPTPTTTTLATGPSAKAKEDSEDEHGCQWGHAKRPWAISVVTTPKSNGSDSPSASTGTGKGVLRSTPLFVPNQVSRPGPHYIEIDELEEDMIVGLAPKIRPPYVDIPPAPKAIKKTAALASGLQEDDYAVTSSLMMKPPPPSPPLPLPPPPLPSPLVLLSMITPQRVRLFWLSQGGNGSVASTGEQLLQESNRRLAKQEANAKLLTGQVAALQQEANSTADSMEADALSVVIRTDAAQTPTAAAAQPEEEIPATATAP